MDQGIHEGLSEAASVEVRYGHPEESRFHLLFAVAHIELLFDMFEPSEQGPSFDAIHENIGSLHDLEGDLMRGKMAGEGRGLPEQEKPSSRRNTRARARLDQAQGAIEFLVPKEKQRLVSAVAFDHLPKPRSFERVKIRDCRGFHRQGGVVQKTEIALAGYHLGGEHRNVFGGAILSEPSAENSPIGSGHKNPTLRDQELSNGHAPKVDALDPNAEGWTRPVCHHGGKPLQLGMGSMESCRSSIVFNPEVQVPTLCIRHSDKGFYEVPVGNSGSVGFELADESFGGGQGGHRPFNS